MYSSYRLVVSANAILGEDTAVRLIGHIGLFDLDFGSFIFKSKLCRAAISPTNGIALLFESLDIVFHTIFTESLESLDAD